MSVRKIAIAAASFALTAGLVVGTTGGAGATATTYAFTGSVSSTIVGSVKIVPALTLTPSTTTLKLTLAATLSGLTGNVKEKNNGGTTTLTGGSYKSVITLPIGTSCTTLLNGIPAGAGKLTWTSTTKGTGLPAANSTITFGGGALPNTAPITATLGGPGTTTKGSFAKPTGSASNATLIIDQDLGTLVTKCGGAGVAKLTFTGTNGASNLTVG